MSCRVARFFLVFDFSRMIQAKKNNTEECVKFLFVARALIQA